MNINKKITVITLLALFGNTCLATDPNCIQRMQISYINALLGTAGKIACVVTNPKAQIGAMLLGGAALAGREIHTIKKASQSLLPSAALLQAGRALSYTDATKIFAKHMALCAGIGAAYVGLTVFTLHSLCTWIQHSGWNL